MALNNAPDNQWTGYLRVAADPVSGGGIVPPSLTTAERDALVDVPNGVVIYNTTTNKLNVKTATAWEEITSA